MCYKSINFLSQAICNTYPEMLHAAVFRRESVAEVEVAEQVLYVVPHFMGYDVSVGEITVGSYLSFHVFSVMMTDVVAHSSSIKFHVSINYLSIACPHFGEGSDESRSSSGGIQGYETQSNKYQYRKFLNKNVILFILFACFTLNSADLCVFKCDINCEDN